MASARMRRNTTGAIVAAHGDWMRARVACQVVGIAAYDLSAAFNTLDNSKLVEKIQQLGISTRSIKWISNYLRGRSQRVVYNNSRGIS